MDIEDMSEVNGLFGNAWPEFVSKEMEQIPVRCIETGPDIQVVKLLKNQIIH